MSFLQANSCSIEKINETLYSNLFLCLLKFRSNTSKAKKEIRNLIRQTEFHCAIQNVNKKSTNDLKFQLILEYSSIVDREKQENLLSVINDDLKIRVKFNSSPNSNFDLRKASKRCMELVKLSMNLYFETPAVNNDNVFSNSLSSTNNMFFNNQKELNLVSVSGQSHFKKNELFSNRNTGYFNQPEKEFGLTSHKSKGTSLSITSTNNIHHPQRQDINSVSENPLKRRANESNEYISRFSKRQNSCLNKKQADTQPSNTLKNNFLSASSMYKNPLKKAKDDNKNEALQAPEFGDSSGSTIQKHPSLKNFDGKIVNIILSEIMDFSPDIKWSDIAGLEFVKSTVQEIVIWPLLRPDIFTGLRAPPRGILLFGPPGTGKTLIGKCIATESNSTFFCISASSLSSKWVGESEQLVRALFAIAQLHQPAVIFIDEIDSLLSQRSDQEQDHTRKLKTEFLVQFDGAKTTSERRVLVVGATNRPHELDEAARRRFVKRLYVPLPEKSARLQIIEKLLLTHQHGLSNEDLKQICEETDGYSGSDVAHLCKEAAMGPIRSIGPEQIKTVSLDQVRPIELKDFLDALKQVRASVAQEDLNYYLDWNKKFGSFSQ